MARLAHSGLLEPYLSASDRRVLWHAGAQRRVWLHSAPPLFTVRLTAAQAAASVRSYAAALGISPRGALQSLPQHSVRFQALALDASGHALAIMHSDEGLRLLLDQPSPQDLARAVDVLMRPFPAGLMTPVGLLVANPAYADRQAQARFTRFAYHGTVVWAWQEAVWAAGLDRQLMRHDLPAALSARLRSLRSQLWEAIDATRALRAAELWSWSYRDGRYYSQAFQPLEGGLIRTRRNCGVPFFWPSNPCHRRVLQRCESRRQRRDAETLTCILGRAAWPGDELEVSPMQPRAGGREPAPAAGSILSILQRHVARAPGARGARGRGVRFR